MIRTIVLILVLTACGAAPGQEILRLSNPTENDIVMKYLPRNQRGTPMKEKRSPVARQSKSPSSQMKMIPLMSPSISQAKQELRVFRPRSAL